MMVSEDPKRYFDRLGDEIQEGWARAGLREAALPEVAAAALAAHPPAEHLTLDGVLDWFLRCPPAQVTPQRDLNYWTPLLTVYVGHRFYIAFHLWADATPRLHSHGFTGAFEVAFGQSLQARYRFETEREINARLRVGKVAFDRWDVLGPGQQVLLGPGTQSIHGLFHLARPTCTLVVRSEKDVQLGPECNYLPPALAADLPGDTEGHEGVLARRIQTIDFIIGRDPYALGRVVDHMRTWDAVSIVTVVQHLATQLVVDPAGDPAEFTETLQQLLMPVADRDVALAQAVLVSLVEDHRRRQVRALRPYVQDVAEFAALGTLLDAPDRATALALLGRLLAPAPPTGAFGRLVERLAASPAATAALGLDASEWPALGRILESDPDLDELVGALKGEGPSRARLQELFRHPLLRPLVRPGAGAPPPRA